MLKQEMSEEAKRICERGRRTKPGDLLSYTELQNLTGLNDLTRLRGFIRTAFNTLFRQSGMRFKCERGIGYVRLDEDAKNTEVSGKIKRIGKLARRASRLHRAVALNALDAVGKLTHIANATQLTEIKKAASRSRRNAIATTASETKTAETAISRTLEWFRRTQG